MNNNRLHIKGFTLVEVLVATVILTITVTSILMALTTYHKQTIRNGKAFIAQNIITEFFEKIRNFNNREEMIDSDSGIFNYITSGDEIVFKVAPGSIIYGASDWASNSPIEILTEGVNDKVISFTLSFDIRSTRITESNSSKAEILELTGTVKWDDGELSLYTLTEY